MLNEAAIVVDSLSRLQDLRGRGVEVVLVDGGSSDGSVNLAEAHVDRVIHASTGRATQMNAGAAVASGQTLLFLHVDTCLPADADRMIADTLAKSTSGWGHFGVTIEGRHPLLPVIAWSMNRRSRVSGVGTGDQALFIRRDWFDAAGGFPAIALMEDIALCKILRKRAWPNVVNANVTTSGRRWERHGVVRTILLMWWLRLRYFFGARPEALAVHYESN
jgi:rSAM/selenodomain-associated transferase 2